MGEQNIFVIPIRQLAERNPVNHGILHGACTERSECIQDDTGKKKSPSRIHAPAAGCNRITNYFVNLKVETTVLEVSFKRESKMRKGNPPL